MSVTPPSPQPAPLRLSSGPYSPQPSGLPPLRSYIRRILPTHSINTPTDRTHHPRKTDHRSSTPNPEYSPLGKHAESNLFPTRTTETGTRSSRPAHPLGCHAPQAYWPKGADPCPMPRAFARPPLSHHWRRPPPSSPHWSIYQSAVTNSRSGGAAPGAH